VAEPETVVASDNGGRAAADGGAIVALPGEKLSGARRGARPAPVEAEVDADAAEVAAGEGSNGDAFAGGEDGQRRRRRRRGGRGRGRGRELQPSATEPGDEGESVEEGEPIADTRPPRANSTFGSIWDSQLGVSPARAGATPSRRTESDEDDLDEPPIPEYLIAERRGRGGQGGGRGRGGPRGGNRGAYAAALDRERFGGGRGGGGGTRYSEPPRRDVGRGRQDFRDVREARPHRGSGDEPWSEVPPELEAMLRAQIASRRPAGGAAPQAEQPTASAAPGADEPAKPAARRRTTSRSKPSAASEVTVESTAKPTRGRGRAKATTAAAPEAAATDGEAAATPKRRTTRKAASTTETTTPKRRTTRKAASTDAE
jgi:hypothetical protein